VRVKKQKLKVDSKRWHGASNRPESAGDPSFPQVLPIMNTAAKSGIRVRPAAELHPDGPRGAHVQVGAAEGREELSTAARLAALASKYLEIYRAARTLSADGCIVLDRERLALSLAETGVGSLAEQSLYSLALVAAADGDSALFKEDVIAALRSAVAAFSVQRLPLGNASSMSH
jgi:hypothetical protein